MRLLAPHFILMLALATWNCSSKDSKRGGGGGGGGTSELSEDAEEVTEQPQEESPATILKVVDSPYIQLLKSQCVSCHAEDSDSGLSDITNTEEMIASGYIVPGDAEQSVFYQSVKSNRMPKESALSDKDKQLIYDEIQKLAKIPLTHSDPIGSVYTAASEDLKSLKAENRQHFRYLYFANDTDRFQALGALRKALNSVSTVKSLYRPKYLQESGLIRIDIRRLRWNQTIWGDIELHYPYKLGQTLSSLSYLRSATNSAVPVMRLDWFVDNITIPPLYYYLVNSKITLQEFYSENLKVDVAKNIADGNIQRSGFNNSVPSDFERIIERHKSDYGPAWISYEFAEATDIFTRPVGPAWSAETCADNADSIFCGDATFTPVANEVIYSLPNGMFAFYVAVEGNRVNQAPSVEQADGTLLDVVPGQTCMQCHVRGFLKKNDMMKDAVAALEPGAVKDYAAKVYTNLNDLMDEDNKVYRKNLSYLNIPSIDHEPVSLMLGDYKTPLTKKRQAQELGIDASLWIVSSQQLAENLSFTETFRAALAAEEITRDIWTQNFESLSSHIDNHMPHLIDDANKRPDQGLGLLKTHCEACHVQEGLTELNTQLFNETEHQLLEPFTKTNGTQVPTLAQASVDMVLTGHGELSEEKRRQILIWTRAGLGGVDAAGVMDIETLYPQTNYADHVAPLVTTVAEEGGAGCVGCHAAGETEPFLDDSEPTFTTPKYATTAEGVEALFQAVIIKRSMPPQAIPLEDPAILKSFALWKFDGYLRDDSGSSYLFDE